MAFWDRLATLIVYCGMPTVSFYHDVHQNIFLNVAADDASGLEKVGDTLLTPVQYLLAGKKAVKEGSEYKIVSHFDYDHHLTLKLAGSVLCMQASALAGSAIKGLSFLSHETRMRHEEISKAHTSTQTVSQDAYYQSIGIDLSHWENVEWISPPAHKRRPGEENYLAPEKECFGDITALFEKNHISHWADCGTCIGAYRYAGVIPWDDDLDLALLQQDFQNAWNVLHDLDSEKYHVQDWSARDLPQTYIRVYVRETRVHLDIYFFKIDIANKTASSIVSNEESDYMPESWKIRERRFKAPTPFDVIFPLKKAHFDGLEIFVPNQTKKYLQLRYGENIEPAKVYNPLTNTYEKDLTHPYWKNAHVH